MKAKQTGPEFVKYLWPVIDAVRKRGGSSRPSEVYEQIAADLNMGDQQRAELLAGGGSRFENQVAWARFYLAKAGYLDQSVRGVWTLTDKGQRCKRLAADQAMAIFRDVQSTFRRPQANPDDHARDQPEPLSEPVEAAAPQPSGYQEALRQTIMGLPPQGFERLCQRLLRESGFEDVQVTAFSADGGIDGHGLLQINPFVSFRVLFQCKRYQGSVSVSQVRDFRGAMIGHADKGIILTTGTFTADARKEALRDGAIAIELVDGDQLLSMFEKLELGLKPRTTYDIDLTFFEQFR